MAVFLHELAASHDGMEAAPETAQQLGFKGL
jgi:hypothetical protein